MSNKKAFSKTFLFLGDDQDLVDWGWSAVRRRWRNATMVRVKAGGDVEGSLRTAAPDLVFVAASRCADYLPLVEKARSCSEVPIVVLLRDGGDADRCRALALGADECIACPGEVADLLARTRAVLRRVAGQGFWPAFLAGA